MITIYKRELAAFFRSPIAYSVIGLFMVFAGLFFWIYNIASGIVNFGVTLNLLSSYLVFFAPVMTMKLLAEEKKNGTEVLLRTSPVTITGVVIGKYLAAFTMFFVMLALTLIYPAIMVFLGKVPFALTISSYVAFILLGMVELSIGLFASSLTENQMVAAVIGVVSLFVLQFMQTFGSGIGGALGSIFMWISPEARYTEFCEGLFNFGSVLYYLSFTGIMLFVTIMNIERKRWN